jgi:hypothetical protein
MNPEAGFLVPLGQRFKKILAIHVVEGDFFAAIATVHEVVNGPVIFIAQWVWHGAIVTSLVANVKQKTTLCFSRARYLDLRGVYMTLTNAGPTA